MSRKRQLVINIVVILALCFFYMRIFDRYISPESVFYACEKGLLYGPSEEILTEYESDEGSIVIVGKYGEGLSIVSAERKMFGLWGLAPGMITGLIEPQYEENMVFTYDSTNGIIIGLTNNPQVSNVHALLYNWENEEEYIVYDIDVKENGFFFMEKDGEKLDFEIIGYRVEGMDEEGNVLELAER